MAGFILDAGATITCPHGGRVTMAPRATRVALGGKPPLLVDDLEYLLDRVNVDKAHAVLGVSMGGVTAINFAIRYPQKLSKFIACDCNVAAGAANNKAWAERVELAKK